MMQVAVLEAGLQALAQSGCGEHLESLRLGNQPLNNRAAFELSSWPRLRTLALTNCGLTASVLRRLLKKTMANPLEHLDLTGSSDLGPEGIQALVSWPSGLRTLILGSCNLDDDTATLLAEAETLAKAA